VDSTTQQKYRRDIEKICGDKKQVKYNYLSLPAPYSAAKARNHGVKQSKAEFILFYDVDLVVQDNFIDFVFSDINKIKNSTINKFYIYPCLYLTEAYTKELSDLKLSDIDFDKIKYRYLEGYNDQVAYLAVNTSTILLAREHYINIGGYDELMKMAPDLLKKRSSL
jgi:predicted glycosyltransferase involved in capsule biosynthesis